MSDFVLSFEKDRVLIFDQTGKVQLACFIKGDWTPEREKKIVELATQLYAECVEKDIRIMAGPITATEGKPS